MPDFTLRKQKAVMRILQAIGQEETPDTTPVIVTEKDEDNYVIEAKGVTVPTDGEAGFAKGCTFIDTDVTNGTIASYVNVGDHTACNFDALGVISAGIVGDAAFASSNLGTERKTTATATVDGLTTGALSAGSQFVAVTSGNAAHIVTLPPGVSETRVRGYVGANGFEMRTPAASGATINTVDSDGTNQAAIPATSYFEAECVATDTWILKAFDELGAVITAIVPDAPA